jgi:hexosaminidase
MFREHLPEIENSKSQSEKSPILVFIAIFKSKYVIMKVKSRIFFGAVFLVLQYILALSQEPVMMPAPKSVTVGSKHFLIRNAVLVLPEKSSDENKFAIHQLQTYIKAQTGIELQIMPHPLQNQRKIQFSVTGSGSAMPQIHESAGPGSREAFHISVSENDIHISANSSAGIYYAVETLRQLLHSSGTGSFVQEMELDDFPALPYRAVMMDFSHGGLLTVDEIKRQINFLARFRTNQFCFYSEVSIELDGYSSLNYRASYSREQVKGIVDYARQRHMDVVPFVNFYGHLHELLRNEKYKALGIGKYGHEVDPRKPGVKDLLRDWIRQYASLFQSPFVHVGFDETWETKRITAEEGLNLDGESLYINHMKFVYEEFRRYGITVMAWTDITNFYPDILSKLPTELIPVVWEYAPDTMEINRYLKPVLKNFSTFMIQPAVAGWGNIYPSCDYTISNMDLCLKIGLEYKTTGYISSLWTDAVEPLVRPSWMFTGYGSMIAWQGRPTESRQFLDNFTRTIFPGFAGPMKDVFGKLDTAEMYLEKCLGRTQTGSIVEKWSNPFSSRYLTNTKNHEEDFTEIRRLTEEVQELLINIIRKSPNDSIYLNSLLISARMMHYTASRFIYARTIVDRWNEAILVKKNDIFLSYDIGYTCHGMLVDAMDNNGELKNEYARQWLNEFMPYRLNTMLTRFDTEAAMWRKLYLKFLDYDVQSKEDQSPLTTKSFEELFNPGY